MKSIKWTLMLGIVVGLASCDLDMPKEKNSSFKTLTIEKQDITMSVKYS